MSGYGHKLITLVSDAVVKTQTGLLPHGCSGRAKQTKNLNRNANITGRRSDKAARNGQHKQPSSQNQETKGPQGQPVVEIGVDLPKEFDGVFW